MTIDELARRSGVSTRNIRAYQTRGLLPPPTTVGRTGQYNSGHLARLRYIGGLLERRFSLAAIADLLAAWEDGRSIADVLGFEAVLTAPWGDASSPPFTLTAAQLAQLSPELAGDRTLLDKAIRVGVLEREGKGYRIPDPTLLQIGQELVAAGIPLSAALDERARLLKDTARIAARLVRLFEHHVWEPYVAAGLPPERLPAITEALRRTRPLAVRSVVSALERSMAEATAASAASQANRFGEIALAALPAPAEAS